MSDNPPMREKLASTPHTWLTTARGLKHCAELLWHGLPYVSPTQHTTEWSGQRGAAFLLYAYAFENLIKGVSVARCSPGFDAYAAAKKSWPGRHHDLVPLALTVTQLAPIEAEGLRKLSTYARWAGRYPVPLNDREFDQEQWEHFGEMTTPAETEALGALFDRLEREVPWAFVPPGTFDATPGA